MYVINTVLYCPVLEMYVHQVQFNADLSFLYTDKKKRSCDFFSISQTCSSNLQLTTSTPEMIDSYKYTQT